MKRLFIILFSFFTLFVFAQTPTQTVRGKIVDNETQSELVGAIILIVDTGKFLRNTTSDVNGNFRFENISVGRHVIIFKYIGRKKG